MNEIDISKRGLTPRTAPEIMRGLKPRTALEIMRGRQQVERAEEFERFINKREEMYKKYKNVTITIEQDYFVSNPDEWTIIISAFANGTKIIDKTEKWPVFPSELLVVQLELLYG